jgi:molybdate transport system regulatory protein
MKLSARNQIKGAIQSIKTDQIMAEITVALPGGDTLVSVITAESARNLGLQKGTSVTVVIKSTEVMLATED